MIKTTPYYLINLFLFIFCVCQWNYSQNIELVADINNQLIKNNTDSAPTNYIIFKNNLLLVMDVGDYGTELWEYTGSGVPTLIEDINEIAPNEDSNIQHLTIYNEKLYFSASDGINGQELWVYDGVSTPTMVSDIRSGADSSSPFDLFVFQNKLYFTADDGISGEELWSYDGINDPVMIADIHTTGNSSPNYKVEFDGKLFFSADNGVSGFELWSYDGTNPPSLEQDVYSGAEGSNPRFLTVYNNQLHFAGRHYISFLDQTSTDLYRYDGINSPELIYEQLSGPSAPEELVVYNDKLYFTVVSYYQSPRRTRRTLYSLDVLDNTKEEYTNQDGTGGIAGNLRVLDNNKLYFTARPNGADFVVLEIDMDQPPSLFINMPIIDTRNDLTEKYSNSFIYYNNEFYFTAEENPDEWEVWRYNMIDDPVLAWDDFTFRKTGNSFVRDMIVFSDKLYFTATDGIHGFELWVYDDNTGITEQIDDSNPGTESSSPSAKTIFNGKLYFRANDGIQGNQLFVYDEINAPQPAYDLSLTANLKSAFGDMAVLGNKLYFLLENESFERQIWNFDGVNPPQKVQQITETDHPSPENLIVYKDKLYFFTEKDISTKTLWAYDGLNAPTPVSDHNSFIVDVQILNDRIFFRDSNVYKSVYFDTMTETHSVTSNFFGLSFPGLLTEYNGNFYLSAEILDNTENTGNEFCEFPINATDTSTPVLFDINPGNLPSRTGSAIVYNNILYFDAINGVNGRELWKYDQVNPPSLVQDINVDNSNDGTLSNRSGFFNFIVYNDKLFFDAVSDIEGNELRSFKTEVLTIESFGENNHDIFITPNPAQKFVTINGINKESNVLFFTLSGREIMRKTISATNEILDISMLDPGMYLIQIHQSVNQNTPIYKKLIIR